MNEGPEVVVNFACHTGECPVWHPDERCLYWLDIPQHRLFRHDPGTGDTETFDTGSEAGGFTVHEDGRLLLFMAEGAVRLWDRGGMTTVIEELPGERGNRFNDVIADPEGRVFCGVLSTPGRAGRLYRLDPDKSIRPVVEGTGTANGMGFSPDLRHMYFCDSRKRKLYRFDYDRETGALSSQTVIVDPEESEGKPDGMTVDAEGHLWSARWNGWQLVCHDASGKVLQRFKFPAKKISCVTFGGDEYTDLYVTSAGGQDTKENGELAGALFRLRTGAKGRPEFRSRLR
jgi:D-xylonolactonase